MGEILKRWANNDAANQQSTKELKENKDVCATNLTKMVLVIIQRVFDTGSVTLKEKVVPVETPVSVLIMIYNTRVPS